MFERLSAPIEREIGNRRATESCEYRTCTLYNARKLMGLRLQTVQDKGPVGRYTSARAFPYTGILLILQAMLAVLC